MFRHKYKCRKCGYFTIETDSGVPPPEGQHLFFRHYRIIEQNGRIWGNMAIGVGRRMEDCQVYVKYESTQAVGMAQISLPQRKQQARMMIHNAGKRYKAVAMVSVMYDTTLNRWIFGSTGHGSHQGLIPANIWQHVPTQIIPEIYRFGRTCSEVDCLRTAYALRSPAQRAIGINSCVFASYSPLEKKPRSPCNGCQIWLAAAGAAWVDP